MRAIKKYTLLILVLCLSMAQFSYASEEAATEKTEFDASEMIMHHISDAHDWHFATIGHTHVTIPLLVILFNPETKGVDFYCSSDFKDETGHANLKEGKTADGKYTVHHDKIHPTDENAHVYDLSITKNVASMLISIVLLLSIFLYIASRYKRNPLSSPKGIQSLFEVIILYIIDEVARPALGEAKYRKYLPYLLTVFFFIWFNNLLGLMPGGVNLTGNIAVTMMLAVTTFLITTFSANGYYWKHIFWTPGVPLPLRIIILPIEVIGIFTKPFALMIRLFANITAGHIIILSFIGLIFIFNSLAMSPLTLAFGLFMSFMELFVAILQAYIFTLLSAMYIGSAIEVHEGPDYDHGH